MKKFAKSKILLLVWAISMALCLTISFATAETLIAIDFLHDCKSSDCRPCLRIETLKSLLNALRLAGLTLFALGVLVFTTETILIPLKLNFQTLSQITLKVRLNS